MYESTDGQSQTRLRAMSPADLARADGTAPEARSLDWLAGPSGFGVRDGTTLVVSDTNPHRDLHDITTSSCGASHARVTAPSPSKAPSASPTAGARNSPTSPPMATTWCSRSITGAPRRSGNTRSTDRVPRPLFSTAALGTGVRPALLPRRPLHRLLALARRRPPRCGPLQPRDPRAHLRHRRRGPRPLAHVSPDGRWLVFSSDRYRRLQPLRARPLPRRYARPPAADHQRGARRFSARGLPRRPLARVRELFAPRIRPRAHALRPVAVARPRSAPRRRLRTRRRRARRTRHLRHLGSTVQPLGHAAPARPHSRAHRRARPAARLATHGRRHPRSPFLECARRRRPRAR